MLIRRGFSLRMGVVPNMAYGTQEAQGRRLLL